MLKLDPEYVKNNEASLIYSYPNTYTFTKSMVERVIRKRRGNLPIAIVRPSIVISAYSEPVEGWTDTLAAGGIVALVMVNGIMKALNYDPKINVDTIPVDYVTRTILAAAAYSGLSAPNLIIVHSTSSHLCPLKMGDCGKHLNRFA